MSNGTSALLSATTDLLAVGIVAGVAGSILGKGLEAQKKKAKEKKVTFFK